MKFSQLFLSVSLGLLSTATVLAADAPAKAGSVATTERASETAPVSTAVLERTMRRDRTVACQGTRIRVAPPRECPNFTLTRTWQEQDLQRTGQLLLSDKLRLLDPLFQ